MGVGGQNRLMDGVCCGGCMRSRRGRSRIAAWDGCLVSRMVFGGGCPVVGARKACEMEPVHD